MGEALYRKYRSKTLDEVVGQEHITTTLKNALASNKISHAYLFTGPRGVGKTSIARILAYQVNDLEYGEKNGSLDIIEIDAASNRRIDEIRELRDKVHTAPTSAKYKVYIIDEVHMLTKEAFNALLKTLEEPPEHAIFILATTEAHKLPDTIISRTQKFTFKPIDQQDALKHLKKLAKNEKISIDEQALSLIIEHSKGSFRDSISMLDQVSGIKDKVRAEDVQQMLGVPPEMAVKKLLRSTDTNNSLEAIQHIESLYTNGYQPSMIAKSLLLLLRERTIAEKSKITDIDFAKSLLQVANSHDPSTELELIVLSFTQKNTPSNNIQTQDVEPAEKKPASDLQPVEPVERPTIKDTKPATQPGDKLPEDIWSKVLSELKGKYNTLYGIARMADSQVNSNQITLLFNFPFHYRRCNEARNKQKIAAIASEVANQDVDIVCKLSEKKATHVVKDVKHKKSVPKSDTLNSVTEIFGGGEVLD